MEYIQGLNFQIRLFFQAAGFGFLLGILYDIFRFVRIIFPDKKAFVIIMDTAYFIICGFLIFCFALIVDNGEIRAYLLAGNLIGWLICYFSTGIASAKGRAFIRRKKESCGSGIKNAKNKAQRYKKYRKTHKKLKNNLAKSIVHSV